MKMYNEAIELHEVQETIKGKLTNWQRNQWAKTGYKLDQLVKWFRTVRPSVAGAKPTMISKTAAEAAIMGMGAYRAMARKMIGWGKTEG